MTGQGALDAEPALDFGHALGTLLRRYLEQARTVVCDLPGGPRGYQVLGVVSSSRCRNQAAVAASLGIDRTVMTYLVDDLEKAGLVERRLDPVDRRARQLVLTPGGTSALARATERLSDVESDVLARLDDEEAATFRRLLQRATVGASPVGPDPCDAASC
jgi:DNA-binding MarR family transcriptional regulator